MGKGAKKVRKFENQLPEKSPEQIAYERELNKRNAKVNIKALNRIKEFKQAQIDTGKVVETQSVHTIPDGTAVKVDGYINGLKPTFLLQNEIDYIENDIQTFNNRIKDIEKAEEKDGRKTTDDVG